MYRSFSTPRSPKARDRGHPPPSLWSGEVAETGATRQPPKDGLSLMASSLLLLLVTKAEMHHRNNDG
jgi:hypothetical protein